MMQDAGMRLPGTRGAKKWWPLLGSAVLLVLLAPWQVAALTPAEQLLAQVSPSLVEVRAKDPRNGKIMQTSGVVIAPQQVITSCFLVNGRGGYEVGVAGHIFSATLVKADTEKDLCLLGVEDLVARPVQRGSSSELTMQMAIWSVAMHKGKAAIEQGVVTQLRGGTPPLIETTHLGTPEAAGGGMFDQHGNLVGICTLFRDAGRDIYFTAPVEWLEHLTTPGTAPGRLHWLKRAVALEQSEQWQQLHDWSRQWSIALPTDGTAWHTLGYSCIVLHDLNGALAAFEQTVHVNPRDIDGWSNLGYVYTDLQRLPEAIGAYREVVHLNPEDVEGWSNLGIAYRAVGNQAEADKAIDSLRRLDASRAQEVLQHQHED